jgi:hypothetical protein
MWKKSVPFPFYSNHGERVSRSALDYISLMSIRPLVCRPQSCVIMKFADQQKVNASPQLESLSIKGGLHQRWLT